MLCETAAQYTVNPERVLAPNILWQYAFLCHYVSAEHRLKKLIKKSSIKLTKDLSLMCVKEINTIAFSYKLHHHPVISRFK